MHGHRPVQHGLAAWAVLGLPELVQENPWGSGQIPALLDQHFCVIFAFLFAVKLSLDGCCTRADASLQVEEFCLKQLKQAI